jgi:hypothetical protein
VDRNHVMRSALWASAVYNLGGTLLFVFPSSLGRLAGLPAPVPRVYTALLAVFVALFGGAYAWLARQPRIDRPLVAMAAIGKAGVFAVILVSWLLGEVPGRGVLAVSGDVVFAAVFAWWLLGAMADPAEAEASRAARRGARAAPPAQA